MSALLGSLRSKLALMAILAAFARVSLAQGAIPDPAASAGAQLHPPMAEPPLILTSGPVKSIAPVFPVMGLIAAAWATHHVRRRNARRLAAIR